jgi:syntaxin 1B/2/3
MEDMNVMVVQQEATVQQIDHQAENVNQDVTNANTQLTGAVDKARAARKKKWICLGIVGKSILFPHLHTMTNRLQSSS